MIAIQALLIVLLVLVFYKVLRNLHTHRMKAWMKIFLGVFTLIAIGVVLFPNSSNRVAKWVGVGRGADLLLYMLTIAFIFTVLHIYIKDKQEERRLVVLTRKVAILEAELKQVRSKR